MKIGVALSFPSPVRLSGAASPTFIYSFAASWLLIVLRLCQRYKTKAGKLAAY